MKAQAAYNLKGLRVAIIDDNPHMLDLGLTMLRGLGVTDIVTEVNGDRALANGTLAEADILLLDWLRGPMSCQEYMLIARNQLASPNPFIPIILMRGFTESYHVSEARDMGMTEVLKLPISPLRLYQRIVRVIERPRPFIDAPGFFGPDRRRVDGDHNGNERRQWQPPRIDRKRKSGPRYIIEESGLIRPTGPNG
jgi:two-component system chemotaxis response regulator CheY